MAPAIVVENVSKKYRLTRSGEESVPYRTLRDDVVKWATYPVRRLRGQTSRVEDFWALRDVSFEVQPGEVVGVIGRNGAGKSTLLKVLSRITKPTGGRVRLRGRVGSLLEVGTGFHPELTGRENIYLSGAVLGMRRAEIRRKFDEMVAFAEVEKFLDLPVKRYSSGMYMRLAFAVAAHLEPEILIIDEVLAVGDAAFQKKCLGKMSEVAKFGRTVVFVSHNLPAVRAICGRCAVLAAGEVVEFSSAATAVNTYAARGAGIAPPVGTRTDREGTGDVIVADLRVEGSDGRPMDQVSSGGAVALALVCESAAFTGPVTLAVSCWRDDGTKVWHADNGMTGTPFTIRPGRWVGHCTLDPLLLPPGRYSLNVAVYGERGIIDHVTAAGDFQVVHGDVYRSGRPTPDAGGVTFAPHSWAFGPARTE